MQTDKSCLVVSGGDFCRYSRLYPEFDYVIACDRGFGYCIRYGKRPDVIIGDFDSSDCPVTDIPVYRHPVMKDDTDTMLAVRHALEKGYESIYICCALGGRFDHSFSNIQALSFAASEGATAYIYSDDTIITVFSEKKAEFPRLDGWSLSCFALSDMCKNVTIRGTKFECENVDISNTFPIGTSNVWKEDTATVECESGIIMVIESRLKKGEHI